MIKMCLVIGQVGERTGWSVLIVPDKQSRPLAAQSYAQSKGYDSISVL
jgi:hypothetical protein